MITFSGYKNLKMIHEGHFSVVYTGLRDNDQKRVILKTLRSTNPEPNEIALLYHEFEVTKGLKLHGVIETYELVEEQNQFALIQEDMQGVSLAAYLKKKPLKDLETFYKIAFQMIDILRDIHKEHIIHKDIKPGNFIIEPNSLLIKLTDFNFASKLLHEVQGIVPPEKLEGTLAYMAPEQTGRMNMNIDYRSDFYAFGVTLFEMLVGKQPFISSDPLELVHAHIATTAPDVSEINPAIPKSLAKIIQKLMTKDPADRYQSAIGIQVDIERCSTGDTEINLGEGDVGDHLNLSQKLYGRVEKAQAILNAYDRVSHGAVEAWMVYGYSGIGKTSLINEVHKPMVKNKGYFITGKFDQLQRNTPYTAITQAFNNLAKLLLSEPEERFESIKKSFLEALGGVAQVLIDLAPDLELVLGKQPPLEKLPPLETQNRMMVFFKRFLKLVANADHPLVLFIDDLQWIDSGSLKLFEYILTDESLNHILLIGAYRDNEVDELHPLIQFFKGKSIQFLPLGPLTSSDFEAFLKDSFNRDDTYLLAELLHKRTEGNPFFCKQVIGTLYQKKLIFFDYEHKRWDWDLNAIKELAITDNVVDLMLSKLDNLPNETQELLKFAACVGNRFTIDILMVISGKSAEAIGKAMWPAMQMELIIALSQSHKYVDAMSVESLALLLAKNVNYQFIHDRVQQAVYQSITEENKQRTHLTIARLLMEKEPDACKKERLFEVTDHFNQAHRQISEVEKLTVVNLNYESGEKAQAANAYLPMSNYFSSALALMDEGWWDTHYELIFKVNREYILSLYLLAKLEEAENGINVLLGRARDVLDQVSIYRIHIMNSLVMGKNQKALELGRTALGLLGVNFSLRPTKIHILIKLAYIKWLMRHHHLESLDKELPILSNVKIEAAQEILRELTWCAYWKSLQYYHYQSLVVMELQLRYGKLKGILNLLGYASVLLYLFNDIDSAFSLWEAEERSLEQFPEKRFMAHSYSNFAHLICTLRYPPKYADPYYLKCIQDGMESGDIFRSQTMKAAFLSIHNFKKAKSLQDLIIGTKTAIKISFDMGYIPFITAYSIWENLFENLVTCRQLDENRLREDLSILKSYENQNFLILSFMRISFYFYFVELFDRAVYFHEQWLEDYETVRHAEAVESKAIDALAIAKCIPQTSGIKRYRYKRHFLKIKRDLKWISAKCPCNYLHHYLFLKATQAKFKGNYQKAIKYFDEAIVNAKKGDFYLWVALGNELAADMLIDIGETRCAIDYIREGHYYYERYGMMVKVKSLEKRFPEYFRQSRELVDQGRDSTGSSTGSTTSSNLDFTSVIKASQSISGEIVLEKLFEKMLHITVENAGAQKSVFIEQQKNQWWVTASLFQEKEGEKFQMVHTPLKEFGDIPIAVINASLRAKEPMIIDNPKEDSRFNDDPYISHIGPKSILCLPIIHHDHEIALIYLENKLTAGAFTADRITVLRTLSTQIAISLENARHLEHTEFLYRASERFVPKRFLQLLQREHLEDVQLGDSVKRKISPLFADIRGFTTLAESLTPERTALFLNTYMRYMTPIIRENKGFVNQFLGDGIMALFPESPSDAVNAAVAMTLVLPNFNREIETKGFAPVSVGIGINTGDAMICVLGEEERMDASVVSDTINTASRVEGLNKYYKTKLLISEAVFQQLTNTDKYLIRRVDKVVLKGKTKGMYIYELAPLPSDEVLADELNYFHLFNEAFEFYERGDFNNSEQAFKLCLKQKPTDSVAEILLERSVGFQKTGKPKDWDGTMTLLEK